MLELNPQSIETSVIAGMKGYLLIGDPWLSAERRVGRVDNTWDTSMAKLTNAFEIAAERSLVPVILGDLLHENRDMGKVLEIINAVKGRQAILVPRDSRWLDRSKGHIAAILEASGVAQVAGYSAKRYQIQVNDNGQWHKLNMECHTAWGGHKRLDQGSRAKVVIPSLNVVAEPDSAIPTVEAEQGHTLIKAGRLIRLTALEESLEINVFSVTREGVERISLKTVPIVFTDASLNADQFQQGLVKDSQFVERLRASTLEDLSEEGKEGIVEHIDAICTEIGADDYVRAKLYELSKDVTSAIT
jgi:hypothetical protein